MPRIFCYILRTPNKRGSLEIFFAIFSETPIRGSLPGAPYIMSTLNIRGLKNFFLRDF